MTLPWYRSLFQPAVAFVRSKARRRNRQARCRPWFEALEDRRVPSILLASSDASGTPGNSNSYTSSPGPSVFSADGRYVVFESDATNLVPGGTPYADQVFRKDLVTGNVVQVSVAADGSPANTFSQTPSISADGRYVAFSSDADNLVAGIATFHLRIYVKDMQDGTVTLVSTAPAGGPSLDDSSLMPAISADGRYVAFMNCVTLLDSNGHNSGNVFRKDLQTGDLVEVSIAADGAVGNHDSRLPSISADGRYVAFESYDTNLGPTVPAGHYNDYRKDLLTGEVDLLNETATGSKYYAPSISANGRYVAYYGLVTGSDITGTFRKDLETGEVVTVSVSATDASMSADGRYIAYVSSQDNKLYRKDLQTGDVLNISSDISQVGFSPLISANGDQVAFDDNRFNGVLGFSQLYVATVSSPYTVTNTNDSGPGSLRQAILNADAATGPLTITFNIPTTDPNFVDDDSALPGGDAAPDVFVIKPTSALPALNNPNAQITIDGRTQTAFTGDTNPFGPEVVLDGSSAGGVNGVTITANNNAVRGLDIRGFAGVGVYLTGSATSNTIAGNYLGTDATGTAALGNYAGVSQDSGSNTLVGGTAAADRNLISGNRDAGILLWGGTGTMVQGNYIGTDASGTGSVGNTGDGMTITSTDALIGGTAAGAGNVIAANAGDGIQLAPGASSDVVQGNLIGTDVTGTFARPNHYYGIAIGGSNNLIGGSVAGAGNVISGTNGTGVGIGGVNATGNTVQGNFIGTGVTGTKALGNSNGSGVLIFAGATSNLIGTNADGVNDAAEANVISANRGGGVVIWQSGTSNNVVAGNYIGTDKTGTIGLANIGYGVYIIGGATNNRIGTSGDRVNDAAEANLIAFNTAAGIVVQDAASIGNSLRGNSIHDNGGLGIDLGHNGVTPNDSLGHIGPNNYQTFPTLLAAHPGSSTRVVGTLESTPSTTFTVDFYASATADASGYGEGPQYLGAAMVATDANGIGSFDATLNAASTGGEFISATATDPTGNTSEFSADVVDGAGPQVTQIAPVSPNPRNTPVDSIDVTFSEPIDTTTLDASDLALTVNGSPTLISGALTVTPLAGTTYRISGLDSSTGANGAWTLTVYAGGIDDLAGNAGTGSGATSWLMDTIAPVSQVNALAQQQSALTFPVSVSGNDPAPAGGVPVSGVTTYDVYVSTDGGPYALWTSVPASNPSADFTGQSRHTYGFHSIAHDGAGNVESKGNYNDAVTYVPDLTPPVTHAIADSPAYSWGPYFPAAIFSGVSASSYANGVFTLNWAGADPCQSAGGSIAALSIYEQIDGGTATPVGTITPGSPTPITYNGTTYYVYSGSMTAAALGDGQPHDYSFYSIGTDDRNLSQPVPPVGDVTFNDITYTAPLTAALAVEKGIAERSYVRYLDVVFNQSLPSSLALQALQSGLAGSSPAAHVELLWYGENLTAASTATGSVNLFSGSTATLSLNGSVLSIDFGAGGVTSLLTENNVSGTGSPRTTFGDGWYALSIDPYGDPSRGTVLWLPFFRLLGDVNGDGTVTGPASTAGTDANIVSQSRGQSGPLLNADVNGDGAVNTIDLQEVTIAANAHDAAGATPPSNFPQFQLLAGPAGTGAVPALTTAQLTALLPQAIAAWQAAGLSAAGVQAMQQVRVEVANLGRSILGEEYPGLIEINRAAAGHAWSLRGRPAPNRVDLLTVLEHELGHVVGLADSAQPGDLMNMTMAPGVQRAPTPADVHETVFALLAQEPHSGSSTPGANMQPLVNLWSLPLRTLHR